MKESHSATVAEPKVPRLNFSALEEKKISEPNLSAAVRSNLAARPSSSAARKSASHDPQPIKEAAGAKSGASLFTNNFAQLLEKIGNNQNK